MKFVLHPYTKDDFYADIQISWEIVAQPFGHWDSGHAKPINKLVTYRGEFVAFMIAGATIKSAMLPQSWRIERLQLLNDDLDRPTISTVRLSESTRIWHASNPPALSAVADMLPIPLDDG